MAVTPPDPQGEGGAQNPAYRLASLFLGVSNPHGRGRRRLSIAIDRHDEAGRAGLLEVIAQSKTGRQNKGFAG